MIVSGLSPDMGKMDFFFKEARKITKNTFQEIDYFRIFSVKYNDRGKSLITPRTLDLLKTYDALSKIPEKFTEVFEIVPCILRNKHYRIACPIIYKFLLRYLDLIVKNETYWQFFIKLAYLYEN